MKYTVLYLLLLFFALNLKAQVGINTSIPHSSSSLDILTVDKGILIPRVSLNSTTDTATIPNPANSLLVFNKLASNDIVVGYYYWSSPFNKWIKFLDELDKAGVFFSTFDNGMTTIRTTSHSGEKIFNFTNIKFNSIAGASFSGTNLTLPPGNYMVESDIDIDNEWIDYILRINTVANGIKGTVSTVKSQVETVSRGQQAVFTLTNTSVIDFIPLSTPGGSVTVLGVDPTLSYLKIVKF